MLLFIVTLYCRNDMIRTIDIFFFSFIFQIPMMVLTYNVNTSPNFKAKVYWPFEDDKDEHTLETVPIVLCYNGYVNYAPSGNLNNSIFIYFNCTLFL